MKGKVEKMTNPQEDFPGVKEARMELIKGMPRLLINGKPVPPLTFFFNTDMQKDKFLAPQVKLSAEAGVHIYSTPFDLWPWNEKVEPEDYAPADDLMDRFIKVDPEAVFILRIGSEPCPPVDEYHPAYRPVWEGWKDVPEGENVKFADGSELPVSLGSEYFWELFKKRLTRMIRHYEASPYAKRILVYHIGGHNTNEWFPKEFRSQGLDYSLANLRGFRSWLWAKYKNDGELATAWAKPGITFETAAIPIPEPGRFPLEPAPEGKPIIAFYDLPGERDWVDFSEYTTDTVVRRISEAAEIIKRETGGKKLTLFFYGYMLDLYGSMGGHWGMERMLKNPNVDILGGPSSYLPIEERLTGGVMGSMAGIDSVGAHGKLWIDEMDLPTHLIDAKNDVPWWFEGVFKIRSKTFDETNNLLQRNVAELLVHRTGTWWMDVLAAGSFNHPRLFEILNRQINGPYGEVYRNPKPYRPDVGVILNETSVFYVKSDIDVFLHTLPWLRNKCVKSGATVGFYYLNDFIDGVVPPCKAYVFPNLFYLTDEQIVGINQRLDREGATAIWQYAPGIIGPTGVDPKRCAKVTGIHVGIQDGRMGSQGEGQFADLRWGWMEDHVVSPRLFVQDEEAEVIGRYLSDGLISAARKRVGQHESVLLTDFHLETGILRLLFEKAGAHIWTRNDEVLYTDGVTLMVHSGKLEKLPVSLPAGMRAEEMDEKRTEQRGDTLMVEFTEEATSRWFTLKPAEE